MRKYALLLALLIGHIEFASAGVEPIPPRFVLTWVRFVGVKHVSEKELAKKLEARVPPLWKFWLKSPTLDAVDLEDDRIRIQRYYQENGYYHTEVEILTQISQPAALKDRQPDEQSTAGLPRVSVTFKITEGKPVIVSAIRVEIQRVIDGWDETEVLGVLPLQIGRVFNGAENRCIA